MHGEFIYDPVGAAETHESHHLLANRIRRVWSKIIPEHVQNPRQAILIAQIVSTCSNTNLSWGRIYIEGQQRRSVRVLRFVARIHMNTCCSEPKKDVPRPSDTGTLSGPGVTIFFNAITYT